jgi:hypothetical protein
VHERHDDNSDIRTWTALAQTDKEQNATRNDGIQGKQMSAEVEHTGQWSEPDFQRQVVRLHRV